MGKKKATEVKYAISVQIHFWSLLNVLCHFYIEVCVCMLFPFCLSHCVSFYICSRLAHFLSCRFPSVLNPTPPSVLSWPHHCLLRLFSWLSTVFRIKTKLVTQKTLPSWPLHFIPIFLNQVRSIHADPVIRTARVLSGMDAAINTPAQSVAPRPCQPGRSLACRSFWLVVHEDCGPSALCFWPSLSIASSRCLPSSVECPSFFWAICVRSLSVLDRAKNLLLDLSRLWPLFFTEEKFPILMK